MKNGFIKVAAVTPSLRVADCRYNTDEMISLTRELSEKGVNVTVFPELAITGSTCGDLFLTKTLIEGAENELDRFIKETADCETVAVLGLPYKYAGKLYNAAAVVKSGELLGIVGKANVLSHGEYSDARYFTPCFDDIDDDFVSAPMHSTVFASNCIDDFKFAVSIGSDLSSDDVTYLSEEGATIILSPSASSETVGKADKRRIEATYKSGNAHCGIVIAGAGTGESTTDLVFAGHSIIAENGKILEERTPFTDEASKYIISEIDVDALAHDRQKDTAFNADSDAETVYFDHEITETVLTRKIKRFPFLPDGGEDSFSRMETILNIQATGLKKRLVAANATEAVIGISGGLDSTLALIVACRAMDMLGRPRTDILGVTMPCFGTTKRTKGNAEKLCEALGISFRTVNIQKSVSQHFSDIGHDESNHSVVYENAQARERTQVIMDLANASGGIVVGTGDLSEVALGWATYNGDHMSMYGVNADVPKTLVRELVRHYAEKVKAEGDRKLSAVLFDILVTPVSPELLPANSDGTIAQVTEDLVGPYELHDFYIYNFIRHGFSPAKLLFLAEHAFEGIYDRETLIKWLRKFVWRFFTQQFKRSCTPDAPKVGSVALSPRGDWRMPSDAVCNLWISEIEKL